MKFLFATLTILVVFGVFSSCSKDKSSNGDNGYELPPVTDVSDWTVDPSQYEHLMTIVAELNVKGNISCRLNNTLAAFSGDKVRGVATPYSHLGCAVFNLIIYSNNLTDVITFGVYLADENTAAAATNRVVFESGKGLGSPDTPYVINVE